MDPYEADLGINNSSDAPSKKSVDLHPTVDSPAEGGAAIGRRTAADRQLAGGRTAAIIILASDQQLLAVSGCWRRWRTGGLQGGNMSGPAG
ncbi:hypothetical protein ACLOJK_005541 [Asimina triloba]